MIIAWDMLGLIGDYCGKIQLNSDTYDRATLLKQNGIKILINTTTRCSVNFSLSTAC